MCKDMIIIIYWIASLPRCRRQSELVHYRQFKIDTVNWSILYVLQKKYINWRTNDRRTYV